MYPITELQNLSLKKIITIQLFLHGFHSSDNWSTFSIAIAANILAILTTVGQPHLASYDTQRA